MDNSYRKELHETIQKARKMFPNEVISYDLDGDISITEFLESVGKVKIFISKLSSIKELAYETNDKITIFTSLSALRRSQYVSDVLSKLVKK